MAVRKVDIVIVCLSRNSVSKRGYIQKEIKYALDVADEQPDGTIFIIPVRLEECEIPYQLHRWQYVNLFQNDGFQRLMRALHYRVAELENLSPNPYTNGASKSLPDAKSVLLISDGTEFAASLGVMAKDAGFKSLSSIVALNSPEMDRIAGKVSSPYKLIILVRGETFSQPGDSQFYSKIRRFVVRGGRLFATAWVGWETKDNAGFRELLPFTHIRYTTNEDVLIKCGPTDNSLAKQLFPKRLSIRTSFELLQTKSDSILLLQSNKGIPIFGYRKLGAGVCYYLNTCQHVCEGKMLSPLQTCEEFQASLKRVFEWIYRS